MSIRANFNGSEVNVGSDIFASGVYLLMPLILDVVLTSAKHLRIFNLYKSNPNGRFYRTLNVFG